LSKGVVMNFRSYICGVCGKNYLPHKNRYRCSECNGPVGINYDYTGAASLFSPEILTRRKPGVWKYRGLLPVAPEIQPVSLGETGTPLHEAGRLSGYLGLSHVYLKDEGRNPTGSFKDRGTSVGMTVAVERGEKAVGTLSHGNMGTSVAAYAAKAGLPCYIFAPADITRARLGFLSVYGATVIQVRGEYDEAYDRSLEIGDRHGIFFINSDNPFRTEGSKTIAFEIWEDLGRSAPDWVVTPASSGGLASGIYKGFVELKEMGYLSHVPKIAIIQPELGKPIVSAFQSGAETITRRDHEYTSIVRSLGNPYPPSGNRVLKLMREFDGTALSVSDGETIEAQRNLARYEGILAEPAGAVALAGLKRLIGLRMVSEEQRVVLVVSGAGFRDPGDIESLADTPTVIDIANLESVIQECNKPGSR
jgi:threonine synthase